MKFMQHMYDAGLWCNLDLPLSLIAGNGLIGKRNMY